ncbi:hypothetical protein ACFL4N_02540 [Thermodesulfobacteriota bacterium]
MIRIFLISILVLFLHLGEPPIAWCPERYDYRVEVLEARLAQLQAVRDWASRNGILVDADNHVWR